MKNLNFVLLYKKLVSSLKMRTSEIITAPPPIESLMGINEAKMVWPEWVLQDKNFIKQIEQRSLLVRNVNEVFDLLPRPDMSFFEALQNGLVQEAQLVRFFDSFTEFLDSDENYHRIILYLPFEMLPDKKWALHGRLQHSAEKFCRSYIKAWHSTLDFFDAKASFIDGDVLEVHLRENDLPRVVKAAHLLPFLVQKGIMSQDFVLRLMAKADTSVLKQNIGEALFVMKDFGLISEAFLPKSLPIIKHAVEPAIVTAKRRAWLSEREKEKLSHLTQPSPDSFRLRTPFSKNLEFASQEILAIQKMVENVCLNRELSQFVFPVALVFGSMLKGYGNSNADIDLAVFVKPGTSLSQKKKLQLALSQNFRHDKMGNEIFEFWLSEKDDHLEIIDFADSSSTFGESYWTHVLFGSAWIGKKESISQLHEKLLAPYFRQTSNLMIRELERDTLLYRLLHKGYARFFPACGGIHTENSVRIDSNSMFYDSGFRQLATRLYLSRVFLPRI